MNAVSLSEIASRLRDILCRVTDGRLQADQVRENASIFEHLGLSSLEMLELRWEIESAWNVALDELDVMKLRVVSDVVGLIASRVAARAAATPA
jgi:acyl carrier protein